MTVSDFITTMRDIGRETVLTVVPIATPDADFAWGMGPFPARVRVGLDPAPDADLAAQVLLDVVVAEVVDIARVHSAWAAAPHIAAAEGLFPDAPLSCWRDPMAGPAHMAGLGTSESLYLLSLATTAEE